MLGAEDYRNTNNVMQLCLYCDHEFNEAMKDEDSDVGVSYDYPLGGQLEAYDIDREKEL